MSIYNQTRLAVHRRSTLALGFMAAATISGIGCQRGLPAESDDGTTDPEPVPVRAIRVESTTLHPSIDLVGTLVAIPERTASVSLQVAGQIQQVLVVEGEAVRAGDVLMRLDARLAEARLAKVGASVDEKTAVLARLKRGYLPQEIEMARQQARKAEASADALRAKCEALTALRDKNEISAVQYAETESALKAAEAEYATTNAKLKLIEAGTRPEEIDEAEAQVAIAQAERTSAGLAVDLCKITSPVNGTVMKLPVRQGMFVQPSTTLAVIVDFSNLFAQIRVPSAYLVNVKNGAHVDVLVLSFPEKKFSGTVVRTGSQADPNTGEIDAFVLVANEKGLLRPDLACRTRVWLPDIADALSIPVVAVADRNGTPVVTVVRNSKAYELEVKLGVQTQEHAQVTQGLAVGDLVVTQGGYGLPAGCPVRILTDKPTGGTEKVSP